MDIQELLFSYSTPGLDSTYKFDPAIERICVDTGASTCISPMKGNFITLQPVTNVQINGIGTGLPIEDIGCLKWSIRDDENNEIDLFLNNTLYVPKVPMGLLCLQQIAQQMALDTNGFHSLGKHGILIFKVSGKQYHMILGPGCLPWSASLHSHSGITN
jgi:hypothetical protein